MEYQNLKFMGREFVKEGVGKKGAWKLYKTKFVGEENDTEIKATAFAGPKKGLCITSLTEGQSYNVGYVEKERTFTNNEGEEVNYMAKTIMFISEIKTKDDKGVKEEEVSSPQPKLDLLSPQDIPIATTTPVDKIVPTEQELVWLNKLKALDQVNVTDAAFRETLSVEGRIDNAGDTRIAELLKWYRNSLEEIK